MRWNAGRHSNRDPPRAVDQQIGKLAGKNCRLISRLVIRWRVIDRVQLDVIEHGGRDCAQPGLGISHRRRWKTCDTAKVPLLVDQHPAHIPFLSHSDQGRIDDAFTVRVIVT